MAVLAVPFLRIQRRIVKKAVGSLRRINRRRKRQHHVAQNVRLPRRFTWTGVCEKISSGRWIILFGWPVVDNPAFRAHAAAAFRTNSQVQKCNNQDQHDQRRNQPKMQHNPFISACLHRCRAHGEYLLQVTIGGAISQAQSYHLHLTRRILTHPPNTNLKGWQKVAGGRVRETPGYRVYSARTPAGVPELAMPEMAAVSRSAPHITPPVPGLAVCAHNQKSF
jgi:hypothetical protein